jgi:uncharacterized protein YchJ
LAAEIKQNRELEHRARIHQHIMQMFQQGKISMEAPCPCGSGLLLKDCIKSTR